MLTEHQSARDTAARRLSITSVRGHPAEMVEGILQAADEAFRVLAPHRLAVGPAGVAQHHPQRVWPAFATAGSDLHYWRRTSSKPSSTARRQTAYRSTSSIGCRQSGRSRDRCWGPEARQSSKDLNSLRECVLQVAFPLRGTWESLVPQLGAYDVCHRGQIADKEGAQVAKKYLGCTLSMPGGEAGHMWANDRVRHIP